jgi:hypothetical protein
MMNNDDDLESQAELDDQDPRDETTQDDAFDDEGEKILCEWVARWKFISLDEYGDGSDPTAVAAKQWMATHVRESVVLPMPGNVATETCEIYLTPKPGCTFSTTDKAFERFARYSETVRHRIKQIDSQHSGSTLADIGEDDRKPYLLDGMIPTGEISLGYGRPKGGKSAWAHKLAICVAFGLYFDDEAVTHGRVLYVTLDPGARKRNVKPRLMEICARLSITPNGNLVIVDDPVILNDPASVASLLRKNPGEFALVIIDPLYKAINGELTQQSVMEAASEGMKMIAVETGAAVLILHHEGRGDSSHGYGSIFLDAAVDAGMHFLRKDDRVTVKADAALFKNGAPRETPFVYRLEGPYLESLTPAAPRERKTAAPSIVPDVHRPDMLALIPTTPTPVREARRLIEHLLSGEPDAREKQWHRARATWADAGLIVQKAGRIWRVAP